MNAKKLGFGLMRLPRLDKNDESSVDIEQLKQMVDLFMQRGFTYFDTAWMYCGHNSEKAIKTALTDRYPRDSYTLTTKLHSDYVKSRADRDKVFNAQLEKTGVEYFDYYLLHDVGPLHNRVYDKYGCYEWLKEKKAQGLVKHIGFSFHDSAEYLDKVLTQWPEMEYVQLQLNYLDWDSEGVQSRKCYETAVKHGKKVIVMEPVKGGTLAKVPEAAEKLFKDYAPDLSVPSWGIRFAASLDSVAMVLSGMSSLAQMEDNTSYMQDFKPLNEEEQAIVKKTVDIINASITVACTGCSYCTEGCPKKIAIPRYFSLYNLDMQESSEKEWTAQVGYYYNHMGKFGMASDCIKCGRCEAICPQHLPIRKYLEDVAKHFGR